MLKRIQIYGVLVAWFFATGVQWEILQTLGWGRMIALNSRAMPLVDAVRKTFNGEMCPVCKMVNEAKRSEAGGPLPSSRVAPKLLFFFQPSSSLVFKVPEASRWFCSVAEPLSALRAAPPTPPPRFA